MSSIYEPPFEGQASLPPRKGTLGASARSLAGVFGSMLHAPGWSQMWSGTEKGIASRRLRRSYRILVYENPGKAFPKWVLTVVMQFLMPELMGERERQKESSALTSGELEVRTTRIHAYAHVPSAVRRDRRIVLSSQRKLSPPAFRALAEQRTPQSEGFTYPPLQQNRAIMAKTSKSSKASTTKTSSSSALKTSSKAKGSKPATQSRSNLKGLKVRDRKDVENMNDLKNIGELHSRLSTTSSKKQAVKKQPVNTAQPQQSATELADSLANTL
ncbi:hypothetical protein P389DRAFT_203224 [Cystobasidium minutum MCA 4210]|uniref:uncharacterized protein n=1 Tax=Cystobasidium minutum MCA 4210 TaxID=1397322 RepID=UPI0034CE20F5|eukprot:jgi/Rhomi1/203224/MIX4053_61_61